jgi:hypothetical protein
LIAKQIDGRSHGGTIGCSLGCPSVAQEHTAVHGDGRNPQDRDQAQGYQDYDVAATRT